MARNETTEEAANSLAHATGHQNLWRVVRVDGPLASTTRLFPVAWAPHQALVANCGG